MSYNVVAIPEFSRQVKRLAQKYKSLKIELTILFNELSNNPTIGTPLGNDIYKIRIAISSKGKGKRGGGRVITYVKIDDSTVLLLSIYDKSEKKNISIEEIQELIEKNL